MPRKMTEIGQMAAALDVVLKRQLPRMFRETLEDVGAHAEHRAKEDIIGRIRPLGQVGPFQAWAPLAESTIESKASQHLGKDGDPRTMLYATGELHDSINYKVYSGKKEVVLGTDCPHAGFLEYGTGKMPPRPFVAPAMYLTVAALYKSMETRLSRTLSGSQTFYRR
jgi:HK97 gp10 family phage protein